MERRQLGRSGIEISKLAFGGNVFGWTVAADMSFQLLDKFVAYGGNFIDTADVYSRWIPGNIGGESETIIGQWLKRRKNRNSVIIASKVGMEMGEGKKGLAKKYILASVEGSLRRLQTDYIDLYQSHIDDPDVPLEETLEAYAQLIKQGKIRAIGASNYSAARLTEALKISKDCGLPRYESLQPLYNLYDRADYESSYPDLCLNEEIGVITYFSLAKGFLSGKYRHPEDFGQSPRGGNMSKYLNERGLRILKALAEVATRYDSTPTSIALSWLMAKPSVTAPIASATKLEQLDALIKATQIILDAQAITQLNQASA
jgi:aryl-alcohol dehydrogenase-like predicted oxidoreductase